jgi:pyrimidine operon attenuation protein/uracil phosphoribosyltransferase
VGIHTRGAPIAERLAGLLRKLLGEDVAVGAVDITLYRDDIGQGSRWPVLRGTEIPFNVEGADIVLVDDVLFTGRTVRAALNTVCDLGRPARVRLAVLVDRGHREIPIEPDVVGLKLRTERGERVRVRVTPLDPLDEIVRVAEA